MPHVTTDEATQEIELLMTLHPKGFDLSLDRIRALLEKLGNPQNHLPPVIHIAGTNGKGSASAFCRSILEAAGHSVHVHTSPHLVNWHERYRIGRKDGPGQFVDDATFADALRRVGAANDGAHITVFEILTAVTCLLFSEIPADVAIIEVGLGGRFDATNVIDNPAVSVIMPVSMDHQAYLGDSVELIAAEKAGIIKSGRPVVVGEQREDAARETIEATAERVGSPIAVYGQDFSAYEEHGRLVYQDEFGLSDLTTPQLRGRHQLANAAAAIRALKAAGFEIDDETLSAGLQNAEWPARMQRITEGRLFDLAPTGCELWLDGGHNPDAGRAIAEILSDLEEKRPRPLFLIAGMLSTKDPISYFQSFTGIAKATLTVPIENSDAGIDPLVLSDDAHEAGLDAEATAGLAAALARIAELSDGLTSPPRILICGSLYLAGEALKLNGTPPT